MILNKKGTDQRLCGGSSSTPTKAPAEQFFQKVSR